MVRIKDRKENIEMFRMALNIAEVNVTYEMTDLILKVQVAQLKKGGKFTLKDGIHIYHAWKNDWEKYYKDLERLTEEDMDRIEKEFEAEKKSEPSAKYWKAKCEGMLSYLPVNKRREIEKELYGNPADK